ncbi:MAG: TIGR00268 family protein [Chloroflexi bacterium RBG_16_57_11]|nr:MAG: TIGR00268 family protein [Chloroflexi bacterium RBG_16_57_11]
MSVSNSDLDTKYQHLLQNLAELESAVIALSGGVDSALLAYAAHQALGERAIAMTADSPSLPRRELAEARRLAQKIGIRHIVFNSHEMENPRYTANPLERCYFCKVETFTEIERMAQEQGYKAICYGENLDDNSDFRPGSNAAREFGVCSPLKEARLGKQEIRQLAQRFDLPVWDKPASACLSSRFPYGAEITIEKLSQVEEAEDYLWELGFQQYRVRHHDTIARIEIAEDEMGDLLKHAQSIVERFRQLGFKYIALDLAGYRRGSLNEPAISTGLIPFAVIDQKL